MNSSFEHTLHMEVFNDKKPLFERKYQSYKGAVGTTLFQNEAELKISKEIDHQISSTDQAGIFPACSVSEVEESMSI